MKPIHIIFLFGLVSFFADIAYEGARSITGPFLGVLGATGFIVGAVSGFGELIGYAFRAVSGVFTDKSRRYWFITGLGYALNLLSIPLLAFVRTWEEAFVLLFLERLGKAIRTPARDTLLSFAAKHVGSGRGFGIHKFLDQLGAVVGPIFISIWITEEGEYRTAFLWLSVPVILCLASLILTRFVYPYTEKIPVNPPPISAKFSHSFWIYVIAVCFIAAGIVDYPLIAYHFQQMDLVSPQWIPITYALAMGTEGASGLVLGPLYDRFGLRVLLVTILLVGFFPFLIFGQSIDWILGGVVLWGIGMGAQETLIRAYVADTVGPDTRATAYGYLNSLMGIAWFLGSALTGWLYDYSILTMVLISALLQWLSLPILGYLTHRKT